MNPPPNTPPMIAPTFDFVPELDVELNELPDGTLGEIVDVAVLPLEEDVEGDNAPSTTK